MPAKPNPERDERVKIPLDPETALRALLVADSDSGSSGRRLGRQGRQRG